MVYTVRPDVSGTSTLVHHQQDHLHDVVDRTAPVYGVVLHCTGSGIVTKALKVGADPLEYAVQYYMKPDSYFAHYVIDFDGTIAQIADEHEKAMHVGFAPAERQAFLSGAWESKLSSGYVAAWKARWPGVKSPAHMFPGPSPNNVYVGMEMLCWQEGCGGSPRGVGMLYTSEQHRAAAALCNDIGNRWGLPPSWRSSPRMVCHEDVNPLTRTARGQGWDPGVVRRNPSFDWPYFQSLS
jgi:hypothetical protein